MPIHHYEFKTARKIEDASATLRQALTQLDWIGRPKHKDASFSGKVDATSFRIMRVIQGRDSFNPMMYGTLYPADGGTRVKVVMTFHPMFWAVLAGWTAYFGYQGFFGQHAIDVGALVFGLFIWAIALPCFYFSVRRNEQLLQECLKNE